MLPRVELLRVELRRALDAGDFVAAAQIRAQLDAATITVRETRHV